MNDSKSKKRVVIASAVFLILTGIAAAWFLRSDPVDEVRQLRNQLFSEDGKKLSPEERKEGFQKVGTAMKSLTPQQRKELFAERQKKMSEDLDRFFKLSPEEQTAELDKRIDRMLSARKAWENGGKGVPGFGGPGGKGFGGPGGRFGGEPGASAPGGNGSNNGPSGVGLGGPGSWSKKSPQEREQARQTALDYTTPQFQAQMADFRSLMNLRMQQRGISFGGRGPPP
jgi:hypothetical protein